MRIVLDTDAIVAALRSPSGASAELLRLARRGRIQLVCSVSLFMEYEAVCSRAEHLEAAGISADTLPIFLSGLATLIEPVRIHFLWRPQLRDPADEMVLEAAVNGRVDALVSFNKRHFQVATRRFNLALLFPSECLRSFK